MKVVILCGGQGTRLKEYTEAIPKPLVDIGGKPILWHVMKIYSHYGFNDFILCLGYKGHLIKEYFMNYASWRHQDFILDLLGEGERMTLLKDESEKWRITFVDTGLDTQTGGRLKRIEDLVEEEIFMATYADGVSNIDICGLLAYHKQAETIGTITVIQPESQFGEINIDEERLVTQFKEKPRLTTWINGGFFVFHKRFFDYLDENSILENEPLENLAKDRQLAAHCHYGYWKCMDTFKDAISLNRAWEENRAEWKVW